MAAVNVPVPLVTSVRVEEKSHDRYQSSRSFSDITSKSFAIQILPLSMPGTRFFNGFVSMGRSRATGLPALAMTISSPALTLASLLPASSALDRNTWNAYDAAGKNGKVEELHSQLVELAKSQNTGTAGNTSIPATFLRVTVNV